MTSSVTIFAYFRVSTFRNTKIVAAGILPPESLRLQRLFSSSFENASEFGLFYDVRAIFAASVAILVAILVVKVFLMGTRVWARPSHCQTLSDASKLNHSTQVAIFRSYDLPYSAGTLTPLMVLGIFWKIGVRNSEAPQNRVSNYQKVLASLFFSRKVGVAECVFDGNQIFTQSRRALGDRPHSGAQGCLNLRNKLQSVKDRSRESWSVVQLVNIVLLTEPLVLLGIYV
ncbi:hypothetical protein FI667_g12816, partial [Globisporangium splendens]